MPVCTKSFRIKLRPRMFLKRPILSRVRVPAGDSMEVNGKGTNEKAPPAPVDPPQVHTYALQKESTGYWPLTG